MMPRRLLSSMALGRAVYACAAKKRNALMMIIIIFPCPDARAHS